MIFQSKWDNHAVIVRTTVRIVHPGQGVELHPGLRAHFGGEQRLFDSERQAEENEWSDEDRVKVEKALLKSKDFGKGIYLAAGQEVPKEYADLVKNNPRVNAKTRCANIAYVDGEVQQCAEPTVPGGTHCEEHRTDRVTIQRPAVGKPADYEGKK